MKLFASWLFVLLLAGCATTSRDADLHAAGVKTFGTDANLVVHEVRYTGPISNVVSGLTTNDELALASDLKAGTSRDVDLVIWSYSSPKAAATLLRALRYPAVQKLPRLRLLFAGDAQDAEKIRPAVEATGAKFYFYQR
ncbi:MAG: hypothetical protein JWQ71_1226 [Pedosphaera sp.]|nr:hypothetical protein [Pedosphaera sp.]